MFLSFVTVEIYYTYFYIVTIKYLEVSGIIKLQALNKKRSTLNTLVLLMLATYCLQERFLFLFYLYTETKDVQFFYLYKKNKDVQMFDCLYKIN